MKSKREIAVSRTAMTDKSRTAMTNGARTAMTAWQTGQWQGSVIIGLDPIISCMRLPHQVRQ